MSAKPLIQCLQDDIVEILHKYADQGITLGETIGVLEMVKLDVFEVGLEDSEL